MRYFELAGIRTAGGASDERDKIAEQLSKSQLIEAQDLAEKCFASRCEGFD